MHYPSTFTGAAVLLAMAPSVFAVGVATVYNNCGFPIYYADVSTSPVDMSYLAAGAAYSVGYTDQGTGYSIKLSPNDDLSGSIAQFEFTWTPGKVAYDISNINGNPFMSEGTMIVPSMTGDANNPTCAVVNCPAGDSVCTAAYNQPDDTATMVCNEDSNLVFTVCTGASSKEKRDAQPEPESEAMSLLTAIFHGHNRVHARQIPKK